jgi:hypothetical protein
VTSLIRAIVCWLCAVMAVLRPPLTASAEDQPAQPAGNQAFIAVRVVDEKGAARGDAWVHLRISGTGAGDLASTEKRPFVSVKCDPDGWAVFGPVVPGAGCGFGFCGQPEGFHAVWASLKDRTLKAGRNEYTVVCPRETGTKVKGVLLDKDGKPLVGVNVRMAPSAWVGRAIPTCGPMRHQPSCTSDEKGGFVFESRVWRDWEYAVAVVRDVDVQWRSKAFSVRKDEPVDLGELATDLDSKGMKPAKEPEKKEDTKEQGK